MRRCVVCCRITLPCPPSTIFHTFGSFPWLLNVGKLLLGSHLVFVPIVVAIGLGLHPITPAIPRLRTFLLHEISTFKLTKPCLACSNHWSMFTISFYPQPMSFSCFFFDEIRKATNAANAIYLERNSTYSLRRTTMTLLFW